MGLGLGLGLELLAHRGVARSAHMAVPLPQLLLQRALRRQQRLVGGTLGFAVAVVLEIWL